MKEILDKMKVNAKSRGDVRWIQSLEQIATFDELKEVVIIMAEELDNLKNKK